MGYRPTRATRNGPTRPGRNWVARNRAATAAADLPEPRITTARASAPKTSPARLITYEPEQRPELTDLQGLTDPSHGSSASDRDLWLRQFADALLEREFLLEVRVLGVREAKPLALEDLDEQLDEAPVKLSPGHSAQLGDRVRARDRRAVGVPGREHVVYIGNGNHPSKGWGISSPRNPYG